MSVPCTEIIRESVVTQFVIVSIAVTVNNKFCPGHTSNVSKQTFCTRLVGSGKKDVGSQKTIFELVDALNIIQSFGFGE